MPPEAAAAEVCVLRRDAPFTVRWPVLYDPAAMLLECSGDVHLRPGPLHVESASATFLRRHRRQVMTSKANVVFLQETRLTAVGQGAVTAGPAGALEITTEQRRGGRR